MTLDTERLRIVAEALAAYTLQLEVRRNASMTRGLRRKAGAQVTATRALLAEVRAYTTTSEEA